MSITPLPPTVDFLQELRNAVRWLDIGEAGLAAHRRAVAAILKRRFECSMVSLWCMQVVAGQRVLGCVIALDDEPKSLRPDVQLAEADFPEYFEALAQHGICNSFDALSDPRLAGMRDDYLVPQRICSLLDTAVQVNGVTLGVLCIEQRDTQRAWSRADELDLRKAGTTISLALGRHITHALARRV